MSESRKKRVPKADSVESANELAKSKWKQRRDASSSNSTNVRDRLLQLREDCKEPVLLNIPVWGWTADGKTCAIATAVYGCDAEAHGLSLATVNDYDEISELLASYAPLQSLNLEAVVSQYNRRLEQTMRALINDCSWPPGTDEALSYIVAVRGVGATLAHALLRDIRGGSYNSHDFDAKTALRDADAVVLVLNTTRFLEKTVDGRLYKEAIRALLERAKKQSIPVCGLLAKSDALSSAELTKASTELHLMANDFAPLKLSIEPVSIIDCDVKQSPAPDQTSNFSLPSAALRKIDSLCQQWVWAITEALAARTEMRRAGAQPRIPSLANVSSDAGVVEAASRVVELRPYGDFSNGQGLVIGAFSDSSGSRGFIFLSAAGTVSRCTVVNASKANWEAAWQLPPASGLQPQSARCVFSGGRLYVGDALNPKVLFSLSPNQQPVPLSIPVQLVAWTIVRDSYLVGADPTGRLSLLQVVGSKWKLIESLQDVLPEGPLASIARSADERRVIAFDGTNVVGYEVSADSFGAKVNLQQPPAKPLPEFEIVCTNSRGVFVDVSNTVLQLRFRKWTKQVEHAAEVPDDFDHPSVALAHNGYAVAVAAASGTLQAVFAAEDREPVAPPPQRIPDGASVQRMEWSDHGEMLCVSLSETRWQLYRALGVKHE